MFHIDKSFHTLSGSDYFSSQNLTRRYWQVQLENRAKKNWRLCPDHAYAGVTILVIFSSLYFLEIIGSGFTRTKLEDSFDIVKWLDCVCNSFETHMECLAEVFTQV